MTKRPTKSKTPAGNTPARKIPARKPAAGQRATATKAGNAAAATPANAKTRSRVCFLVGSVAISGGTYVIFQHAIHLQKAGFEITLAVQDPFDATTAAWHDAGHTLRCLSFEAARQESYDLVIATWWRTALKISDFDAPRHAYFVQSIESRFYPAAETPIRALVDATYSLPVSYITEATWIRKHLADRHGQRATLVRNGIRKDLYTQQGPCIAPRVEGTPRVLVEGHFNVSFKNTALALKVARDAGAKDIWVLTGTEVGSLPGASRVFSRLPIGETPQVFRSCDILIKLSTVEGMFGPPLEMFHCGGTALVFDVTGFDEYIEPDRNAVVVRNHDVNRCVAELRDLLSNATRLKALKDAATGTAAQWPDWNQSSAQFRAWVEVALRGPKSNRARMDEIIRNAWADYDRDEAARLKADPSIARGHRRDALIRKLPKRLQDLIRRAQLLMEVTFPPKVST